MCGCDCVEPTYMVIRYFSKGEKQVIECGLTLKEAQRHCQSPASRQEGVFFDGYTKEED